MCEDVTFLAPSHEKHWSTAAHVYSRYVQQRGVGGDTKHKPVREPEADRFVEGEACF